MQISRFESVNLVFGFEKFFGQSALAVLSEVGGADATSCRVRHGLGEDVAFLLGDGRDIHIGAAVQEPVVAFDTLPQTGLKIEDRLLQPQRFGVVDGGFGADEKTGFVVLLDGVASEPVFDAGVIVVESPEGLGLGAAMGSTAEDLGDALGQSEALKLIQDSFKETGAKARGSKHDIGGDFHLGEIPFMLQVLGAGGIFPFVEFKKEIHPVSDPVEDRPAME